MLAFGTRTRGLWVRVGAGCVVLAGLAVAGAACGEDPTGMSGPECPSTALCGGTGGVSGMMVTGGTGGMTETGGSGGMQPMDASVELPLVGPLSMACAPAGPLASALGATRTVLYSGPDDLRGLARRSSSLFATDATGIVRLRDGGSSLERVVTADVNELWAADLRLYWISGASAYRTPFESADAEPELVAMGLREPATLLQNDEENLYYSHTSSQSVWRQPLDGTTPAQLVSGIGVAAMELHGGALFYAHGATGIDSVSVEGGEAELIVTIAPRPVLQLDNDGLSLVWIDGTELLSADADTEDLIDSADAIVALSQGGPTRTGATRSHLTRFVRLGEDVYFADEAGSVGHANVAAPDGCALLVQHAGEIRALAVEEDALYVNVRIGETSELWRFAL